TSAWGRHLDARRADGGAGATAHAAGRPPRRDRRLPRPVPPPGEAARPRRADRARSEGGAAARLLRGRGALGTPGLRRHAGDEGDRGGLADDRPAHSHRPGPVCRIVTTSMRPFGGPPIQPDMTQLVRPTTMAAKKAGQKPATTKPLRNQATSSIISPLMTSRKNPS